MPRSLATQYPRRLAALSVVVVLVAAGCDLTLLPPGGGSAAPACSNPVACENQVPGTSPSTWDLNTSGAGDLHIQGFADNISVNPGQTVNFKISTTASSYRIDIYRFGYYQGNGARLVASNISHGTPKSQASCFTSPTTGLVDCGNWTTSASWTVPTTAVSGVYLADLKRLDVNNGPGADSQILFVVRNDASTSTILVKTSDSSWEAYNNYGVNNTTTGASLYSGNGPGGSGRAYKVSYNRPLLTRGNSDEDSFFNAEYPMIRWLERNGYDLSYQTDVDTDRGGASIVEQHKVFMAVGHDEYWSGNERANVEAARAAGVNLAFLDGNEVFWKTRWEPSIDGSSTTYRTLVCYKETKGDVTDPLDPPIWTGTWRDPTKSPPADGGRPENALIGNLFMVNGIRNDSLTTTSAFSKLRLWRNTSVASLSSGQSVSFPAGTLGYEWHSDADNGYRPAGTIDMSSTTVNLTPGSGLGNDEPTYGYLLKDYGNTFGFGPATHSLTLYRASSGALVFGAGTVQWSWGLDEQHDRNGSSTGLVTDTSPPPAPAMAQATINVLADMRAQPATLEPGFIAATASTDTTPPTSTVTSPAASASVTAGTPVTITGSATDPDGGVVAGVEVSVDGGSHWHPAQIPAAGQTVTWSYSWTPGNSGPVTIESRATDDSSNTEISTDATSVTVVPQSCQPSCGLWNGSATPAVVDSGDPNAVELGVKFTSDYTGEVTGISFYKSSYNTGTHIGDLWSASGQLLASATFTNETTSGWQKVTFSNPVVVNANTTYIAAYHTNAGHYSADAYYFANVKPGNYFAPGSFDDAPLHALGSGSSGGNGVYTYGSTDTFPSSSFGSTNYWVDVAFAPLPAETSPPSVTSTSPTANATGISQDTSVSASLSQPVQPSLLTMTLAGPGGTQVPGTTAFNAPSGSLATQVTFTPSVALAPGMTYTATITGATDRTGLVMAPYSWSFTTAPPQTCPCSIWSPSTIPAVIDSGDPGAVSVGVKFTSDKTGVITAIRFYKSSNNTGTHVGDLWSASGQRLASATFAGETASGWQQVNFSAPVAVTAGVTYVASYHTNAGHYSATGQYFASSYDVSPLHALASGSSGGNGVYTYSSTDTFPYSSYGATNYWVDVVFAPDTTPPAVSSTTPTSNATGVGVDVAPTATFSKSVQASTVSFTLTGPGGTQVAGTTSYNASTNTETFAPATPLALSTTYTATISGATDTSGNQMTAPYTWSFTTAASQSCPCTLWSASTTPAVVDSGDSNAIEVGVKFTADYSGAVSGVRFYKSSANTGTHVGDLWSSTGQLLASATFTSESASGWQQVNFSTPVDIAAGTTYIASYHTNTGHYSATGQYFASSYDNAPLHAPSSTSSGGNGVYAYSTTDAFPSNTYGATNYWVDVVFGPDTTKPSVISTTPLANTTGVNVDTAPSVTFNKSVQPSTISFTLAGPAGNVAGTTSYASATNTATFTSSSALSPSTTYTATVGGATDLAGNTMAAPYSWSFTTAASQSCPCTLWSASTTPAVVDSGDLNAVELGVKFTADANGLVTGIRFYKSSNNTGTHVGDLWSSTGQLLANATFTSETASGWQQINFSSPVQITAGITYVAAYHTGTGHYSANSQYFATSYDNPPLHAPSSGTSGGNGVYAYSATDAFPSNTYGATNYWVDIVFSPT